MSNSPLVTIICLCYNHEKFVIEALNSVINQTYKNIEIIIIDDKSSDNSVELIKNWNKNNNDSLILNKKNIGNTKTFNKALMLAKGKFIIDFACDDLLLPNSIEAKIDVFKTSEYKNLGVVFSNVEFIDYKGKHIEYRYDINSNGKAKHKPKTGDIYKDIVHSYYISAPSMMVKKEVYDALNGYDESLLYEDLDFWFRSSRQFSYDYSDEVLVKKRNLSNSLSSNFYKKRGVDLGKSTLKTCKKAFKLNRNKNEHIALKNRVKYELRMSIKNRNFIQYLKFLLFYLKLNASILFG